MFNHFLVNLTNLLQNSSSFKVLDQIKLSIPTIMIGVICLKHVWRDLANQRKWLPRPIIEHRGKMQFLAYNSKTEALRENLTGFNCLSGQDLSAL